MNDLESNRKTLNTQITHLRERLTRGENFDEAIALFFRVHAQLHILLAHISHPGTAIRHFLVILPHADKRFFS